MAAQKYAFVGSLAEFRIWLEKQKENGNTLLAE